MIAAIPAQSFIELIIIVDITKRSGRTPKRGVALYRDSGDSTCVESSRDSYAAEEVRARCAFTGAVFGRTAEPKPNYVHDCRGYCPRMLGCGNGSGQRIQSTGQGKETSLY